MVDLNGALIDVYEREEHGKGAYVGRLFVQNGDVQVVKDSDHHELQRIMDHYRGDKKGKMRALVGLDSHMSYILERVQ